MLSVLAGAVLAVALVTPAADSPRDQVVLLVSGAPADGLVVAPVVLGPALARAGLEPAAALVLRGRLADGASMPMQFLPGEDAKAAANGEGTLLLRLPRGGEASVVLEAGPAPASAAKPWDGTITTADCVVTHVQGRMGAFPSRVVFRGSKKEFEPARWNDRVYHREKGSYGLADDPEARAELVADGPLAAVVRTRGRYVRGGQAAPGGPRAVYDWFYFKDRPLVLVRGWMTQAGQAQWHEHHFLELQFAARGFPRWAGGEPPAGGRFEEKDRSFGYPEWGAVSEGRDGIGMFAVGRVLFHDPRGGQATYLQAHGDAAWQAWDGSDKELSAWLWLGSADAPAEAVRAAARQTPGSGVTVTTREVHRQVAAAAEAARSRPQAWAGAALARRLEAQGRLEEAVRAVAGQAPEAITALTAGDLGLLLEEKDSGLQVLVLTDRVRDTALLAARPLPLFRLTLRRAASGEEVSVTADEGWHEVLRSRPDPAGPLVLTWRKPVDMRLAGLTVTARVRPDDGASALHWSLAVEGTGPEWSVWRVVFPQVAVADLGPEGRVLYPQGAGIVHVDPWRKPLDYKGTYPSGWTAMPFLAVYEPVRRTGLYVGVHDPKGGTKDIAVRGGAEGRLVLAFDHPAADMGKASNRWALPGETVWRLLRGDWYDAALVYRDWVRREAGWYPKLGPKGRTDTPLWLRELPAWALSGGTREECVGPVKEFAKFLGVPVGVHWYSWHAIPFDNDYPHYFPTKPGFAEGVKELQAAGVAVMPYINGRLWDTHDQGAEDFEFTRVARPAATKDQKGEPYVETYGSKEKDGTPVRLAVMCPTTPLWQERVRGTVLRLFEECGVKAVYIDQVAAASPVLCFDPSHSHPLGGGSWWTEQGYWPLLRGLREKMPSDRAITTECNGEPFLHLFDGYLTWHWQYDGQVPAFPAVYGGAVQMFGRQYGGGPTRDLALRMRAAQQLVWGEQLGWINPGVIKEKDNAAFFREVVRLRWGLRPYFYAGEMARPPALAGPLPRLKADWQWGGERWVTTDALLTGAWARPREKELLLLAVNAGDEPVTTRLRHDLAEAGLVGAKVRLVPWTAEGPGEAVAGQRPLDLAVTLPPRAVRAWEVTAP